MSAKPSPITDVDQLEAGVVPELPNFIMGTDIKGIDIHMAIAHIVMMIPGPNYTTVAMTTGHNLQIVTFAESAP